MGWSEVNWKIEEKSWDCHIQAMVLNKWSENDRHLPPVWTD